jgi:hypothetical protein
MQLYISKQIKNSKFNLYTKISILIQIIGSLVIFNFTHTFETLYLEILCFICTVVWMCLFNIFALEKDIEQLHLEGKE